MKEDIVLLVAVSAIWLVLAVLYATVPMFAMPGYATVWGWGSVIFLLLAALIFLAERCNRSANTISKKESGTERQNEESKG